MSPKSVSAVLFLVSTLVSAGVIAGPHDKSHAPASHATTPEFDNKRALEISQAVAGKPVGAHALVLSDGRRVSLADYRGKPLVVSLVYTSCYHICPTTTQHLAKVVRIARDALGHDSFRVLTIGFDTRNDHPVAMGQFARQQNVGIQGWDFAGTSPADMAQITKDLGFIYTPAPHGFNHLIQATVIDANGKVYRQVYGMNFDTPLLVEPLKELVYGKPASGSLLSSLGNKIKLFCTVYDPANDRYRFDYSLFVGIFIGLISLGLISAFIVREWRRPRRD
mgnify:FL=1